MNSMAEEDSNKPLRKMSKAFKDLANTVNSETPEELQVALFSQACSLVSPLFGCLGIAFKFAEMDYVAKVEDLRVSSSSIPNLRTLVDHDIQHNTVRKAGSHSRNLLRVKRGLAMVRVLFQQILANEGNSLKDPASTAYAQVLAPHHGWAIRKAVAAGMYALPTKAQLLKKLNEDGLIGFRRRLRSLFCTWHSPIDYYHVMRSHGKGSDAKLRSCIQSCHSLC